jgi:hypothetical protein
MALALTSRRRASAAVLSVVAAVALAVAVVGRGCGVAEPGPDAAVRGLIAAAREGDRAAVFGLLSPDTQAALVEKAQRATELVGANVRYGALDLIAIGAAEEVAAPTEIRTVEQRDDHAVVELVSSEGPARLDVVKVEGRWRIDLPSYGAVP